MTGPADDVCLLGRKQVSLRLVCSSTVRDLIVGSGQTLTDRGEHELKGVPGPWRVFAVES